MSDNNFESPRGLHALDVSIVFTSLATVIVFTRIYTRLWMVRQWGADDLAVLNALVFDWAFFALFVSEVKYGMGQEISALPPNIVTNQLIALWATIPLYQMTLFSSKVSILLQYRRVFKIKNMLLACNIMLGVLVVYGTWTFVSAWLNCIPVAKFWNDSLPGYCLDKEGLWFSNSAMHILSDIIILLLPMPVLKSLQLPTRQKVALMGVFALGGFVTVTTIIRLKFLLVISESSDPTYDNVGAAMWSAIECNVAIICASLPTIKPLISKIFPRIFSSASYSRSYGRNRGVSRSRTMGLSTVNATVVGPGDEGGGDALDMYDMRRHGAGPGSSASASSQENLSQDGKMGGIKVTTMLSQESVTRDESSSVRKLVMDGL
ncbi:hypothetical protein VTN77DRAFT_9512 [Rasamsonia byssochlamydoides]|uniref:uncharacterized protein n=1 Tax=Rasamsonia byssochlamydoides TaxID=89139 RepID=UPI0037422CF6